MRPLSARLARVLLGLLTVWCLGCESFEMLATKVAAHEGRGSATVAAPTTATSAGARADFDSGGGESDCVCALGHAVGAVLLVGHTVVAAITVSFADVPQALPLAPAPPPVRPPVA